jgi:hypothetical protein
MQVSAVQEDCFQLRTSVVFRLKEPHPHVVGVVVDDEQAIAEAMWGGYIDWSPEINGHVEEGAGWFTHAAVLRGASVALFNKQESQETLLTELANTRLVGTP